MPSKRSNLSFIPPLLPDQTLYSWEAVFHEMSGNATIDETRRQLCGTVRGGRHFHMPSHLNALCASTQLALGTPEVIVRTATILPYYTQFCSPRVAATALRRIRGSSSYGVAQSLGMAATENCPHPPRRSCYQCVEEDRERYGFAYWHRSHQLPGVVVCQKHCLPLRSLPYDHNSISRAEILRPEADWDPLGANRSDWPVSKLNTLHRLSLLAADMAQGELLSGHSMKKLRNACLPIVRSRNLIAPDNSLIVTAALRDYTNHYANIISEPELVTAIQGSIRPLLLVLGQTHYRTRPLEWMLVIDWLFGDWETFQEYYLR